MTTAANRCLSRQHSSQWEGRAARRTPKTRRLYLTRRFPENQNYSPNHARDRCEKDSPQNEFLPPVIGSVRLRERHPEKRDKRDWDTDRDKKAAVPSSSRAITHRHRSMAAARDDAGLRLARARKSTHLRMASVWSRSRGEGRSGVAMRHSGFQAGIRRAGTYDLGELSQESLEALLVWSPCGCDVVVEV
jgi:hypothetical protein